MKRYHRDLCVLSSARFADGGIHFSCIVVTNAYWEGEKEVDESVLSGLIGEFSEEVVFGHHLGKLVVQCDDGPYCMVPAILFYSHTKGASFVNVQRVRVLSKQDIQTAIHYMLEG